MPAQSWHKDTNPQTKWAQWPEWEMRTPTCKGTSLDLDKPLGKPDIVLVTTSDKVVVQLCAHNDSTRPEDLY